MTAIYVDPTVGALRELHREQRATEHGVCSIREYLKTQAMTIHCAHADGNEAVAFHLGCWCPELVGTGVDNIMSVDLQFGQVLESIAREHGFSDWAAVERLGNQTVEAEFERAVDALIEGRIEDLSTMLQISPALVTQTSRYGHRATLLHYIGANGVESCRQITPVNAAAVARCLLEAGASVNAHAQMYGGGTTTLELVTTSAHPHNAGVVEELVAVLKSA